MRLARALLLALLLAWSRAAPRVDDDDHDDDSDEDPRVKALKAEINALSPQQLRARFGAVHPKRAAPPRQSKIDHFVVLFIENHAADNIFGCMDLPGFDGIRNHTVPKVPGKPHLGKIEIECGTAQYVCTHAPAYDTYAPKFKHYKGNNPHKHPYSEQGDEYSYVHGLELARTAVRMWAPSQIPVKAALAREFGVFNKLYSAVPSASSPNHLYAQSATSCGMQANALYDDCGGPSVTFPQKTIYDNLREHNVSFALYLNSTCGLDGQKCHGLDPHDIDSASAISTPDVAMAGVARHADRFLSMEGFSI